jgi:peptide deformylase
MYAAQGIGLAATQVGRKLRLFVIDLGPHDSEPGKLMEFINPVLREPQGKTAFEEGCLSVPGFTEEVNRSEMITVDYQDRFGNPQSLRAHDLLAVAIQHENDHLDGIVFVERLSSLKRRMLKKKIEKAVTL